MKRSKVVIIAVNEQGYRIGSSHHNCRISDEIVDKLRDLHEDQQIGYRRLAKMFNLSRSVVIKICRYERRAQTPDRWKKVTQDDKEN